jgi:soluble lytic murein transglycosylase
MNKKTLVIILLNIISFPAIASSLLIKADKAYTTGNLTALGTIYSADPNNRVISYLYAKAMLTKNIAKYAEDFIENSPNSYMRNDLIHQLLIFNFNNNSYTDYMRLFGLINISQTNQNEKCGYDYSVNATKSGKPILNNSWLISNNIPGWCAEYIGVKFNSGSVSTKERDIMLYNLIINGKTDIFNQIANDIKIHPVSFAHYPNTPVRSLPNNNDYKFLVANRIANIGHKTPDLALKELKQADIDSNTKAFLGNYLAMQFAQKHDFDNALDLYSSYANDYMSDEELEWRVRSYLYYGKWSKVIDSIEAMPQNLKTKNVWLYWEGKSYAQINKTKEATALFEQIPTDYSYYSMLAQAEIDNGTLFKTNHPGATSLSSNQYAINAKSALALYQIGKSDSSKNLVNIATAEWNYAAKQSLDTDLLAMSNLAAKQGMYDLSIYAANQMGDRYLELSFPTPFLSSFEKYSANNSIDKSYALAISRQESRFNYSVIAFDGGVGLMQIMPQTAAYIAKKTGAKNCYHQTPDCNIKFGSWYLGNLYSKFGDNLIYSTAAYNAGPNRSRRWQDKLGQLDNKIQIELIPISITRDYVQKVLTNKAAYDTEFQNKDTIDLLAYIDNISKNHYVVGTDDDNTDAQKINN